MKKIRYSLRVFKQELKNSDLFQRVLSSYLLISCIVFILFSLVLLLSSNREYFSTLEQMQEQTIAQAYNINQTTLKDIIAYCNGLIDKPTMTSILYDDDFSPSLALEATKLNDNMRNVSSLIRSVYFINFRTGTIIDQNGRTRIPLHTDTEVFRILEEMTPGAVPLFCRPRTIDYRDKAAEYHDIPVLSILFFPNKSGSMVLNLDYETYSKLLNTQENSNISIVLINSQGHIMAASDSELFGLDASQSDLYGILREKNANRGSFSYDYEGSHYSVSYIKNEGLGSTYICTRKNHFIYPDNGHLLSLVLYSVIFILVGFVLSMLLSWIIYKPLRRLKAQITSHRAPAQANGQPGPHNDFAFISQAYQEVVDINTRLQHGSETVQKMELYKQLLFGQESYALHASDLEALDASFPEKNYAVLLLGIDPTSMSAELDTGAGIFKYAIRNVTQELLSASVITEYVELDSYYIVFLLNFSTLETEKLIEIVRQPVHTHRSRPGAHLCGGSVLPLRDRRRDAQRNQVPVRPGCGETVPRVLRRHPNLRYRADPQLHLTTAFSSAEAGIWKLYPALQELDLPGFGTELPGGNRGSDDPALSRRHRPAHPDPERLLREKGTDWAD